MMKPPPPEGGALLRLEDVRKEYRMGESLVHALDGVNLSVRRGDYSAILGPSGSGKSTLMHIIGFMDQPTSGEIFLDGNPVSDLSANEQAGLRATEIGFVFQSFNLLSRLTVLENVLLPVGYARRKPSEYKNRAVSTLERVGLGHRSTHRPSQLSGGERQRVAIARALVNHPKILLADEPTGNLDSHNASNILGLFDELADEGNTILLVTHDESIARHTRKIIRVLDGRVTEEERRR